MVKIVCITKCEGGEMGKKCFVVLVQVIVMIDELGKEGLAVNMQFAKLQGKVEAHTKFMSDSIPGQDTTSIGVGHNVGIGVDSEMHLVGAMQIAV